MTSLVARPGTVPVKVVKKKAPALSPYQTLLAGASGPMPTLPGKQTPISLMSGLAGTDWNAAAQKALAPAFSSGMGALNFGLTKGLADANAQAAALQGAYTAAGGQMPRVGSEYSSLGGVLADLGKALAPGMATPTGAAQVAAAGAPAMGNVPLPDAAGASYMLGTAPGQALANSGYYKDIGLAGTAAAEQMQGREQGMVLQRKLQGDALTNYLSGGMQLTSDMLGKIPETGIALSGEARARAAGALSGLQFETEAKMNMQKMIQDYAQMRATATTNAQKLALDKWAQQQLSAYHHQTADAATSRAATAAWKALHPTAATANGLTANARARLMEAANTALQGFYYGLVPDAKGKLVPGNMLPNFDPNTYQGGQNTKSYQEAISYIQRVYSLTKADATSLANQWYPVGYGGRPTPTPAIQGNPMLPVGPWRPPGTTVGPFGALPNFGP